MHKLYMTKKYLKLTASKPYFMIQCSAQKFTHTHTEEFTHTHTHTHTHRGIPWQSSRAPYFHCAAGAGVILSWGTKIPSATQHGSRPNNSLDS